MRKSRFSESQIVEILKEGDAGVPVADLLRKHGISRATYFKWKGKYGGGVGLEKPHALTWVQGADQRLMNSCRDQIKLSQ